MSQIKVINILPKLTLKRYFALEVSPGVNINDITAIKNTPLFVSVTWHAKKLDKRTVTNDSVKLAEELINCGVNVMLHLTCDMMTVDRLRRFLCYFKTIGLRNLLVIQGGPYGDFGPTLTHFPLAKDLVKYIKMETGDHFCIGVAGFPEDNNLDYLLQKQENGADFIITQVSNDPQAYVLFKENCKTFGINLPIIYGIYLYDTPLNYFNFASRCGVSCKKKENVPSSLDLVREIIQKNNDISIFQMFTRNKIVECVSMWEKIVDDSISS